MNDIDERRLAEEHMQNVLEYARANPAIKAPSVWQHAASLPAAKVPGELAYWKARLVRWQREADIAHDERLRQAWADTCHHARQCIAALEARNATIESEVRNVESR